MSRFQLRLRLRLRLESLAASLDRVAVRSGLVRCNTDAGAAEAEVPTLRFVIRGRSEPLINPAQAGRAAFAAQLRRRLMEYLLSPVKKVGREAERER
jgi:hypothetical protein